jgi:uncharacterized protein (TIGR00369 family)
MELPEINPQRRRDLAQAIAQMPASKTLGLVVIGFSDDGYSVIEMPVRVELTFDGTVVQGGLVGTLADYAGVSAAASQLPEGWMASTTGFEVHNLQPAAGEKLVAIGHVVHAGKAQCISQVQVWAVNTSQPVLVCIATTLCRPYQPRPAP